ncbi:unnamed protein product [Heligmosomoides polygyrus]|uniref:RNA-directed DNA polymerase n=1 Tax=Heligmosomoides polygyrus TaxID=6339 RepID=A0A183G1I4_HELPZ|nr:unnamed protein product [Heligmosomoides polygyrus]
MLNELNVAGMKIGLDMKQHGRSRGNAERAQCGRYEDWIGHEYATSTAEVEEMLNELNVAGMKIGLDMNMSKTTIYGQPVV